MNTDSSLPWDTSADDTVATTGADMHARATGLAHAAMMAAADAPIPADGGDYGRACADYERRLAIIRNENIQGHVAANNARAADAAARKAERQAKHDARNAAAKAGAAQRRMDKAV